MIMNLQIFENDVFGKIRTVQQENEILFVATDICKALDLQNVSKSVQRLDDDEKGIISSYTLGGNQNLLAVNEFGLYNLVLSSRKPQAKAFKRWVTHDVIPAIRKTGKYDVKQQTLIEEPYKPTLKYWKGVPVLTKLDVAMILKVDASAIQNYIRRPWFMTENVDFYFLRGHDLFEYRRENKIKSTIAALIVLTESGVRKIYEARNRKFTPAELFPVKSSCEPQRPMLVNAPMNIELQKKIKDLEGKLIALHEVLNLYNRCNTSEKSRCFANTLNELGLQIFSNIRAISDVKLTSYDNYEIGFRLGNMITR